MTAEVVQAVRCDLCGYGGAFSRPEDFTCRGGFDFCRWCCFEGTHGTLSSGGHAVELDGGSWQCSCGTTYGFVVSMLRLHGVGLAVMDAVPGTLAGATASLHVNTPNWPRTY
jgi:hypothetical protein